MWTQKQKFYHRVLNTNEQEHKKYMYNRLQTCSNRPCSKKSKKTNEMQKLDTYIGGGKTLKRNKNLESS